MLYLVDSINRLTVTNFRGFKHTFTIEFAQKNYIIGANGTGKTSILLALQLFEYCTSRLASTVDEQGDQVHSII
jgi:AAA15 family ATPase/GTPase